MEWYEILCVLFFICVLFGSLVLCCIFDYKYKLKKLELEKRDHDDINCNLIRIYSLLSVINDKIEE